MPIHEKSLIRPENLKTHDELVIDGVDVSGHWSTFIEARVVTDYNEALEEEIAALPGGEYIHRAHARTPAPSTQSTRTSIRATGST
jgi:heterodisulfide reductase subunit C